MASPLQCKTKLNLGCGRRKIHGFINIDCNTSVEPDTVDDVFTLQNQPANSVGLIYASHVLEHADCYTSAINALKRWHEVLVEGGILRLAVPDMEKVCRYYIYKKDLKLLRGFIWGGHSSEYDIHHTGWDFDSLKQDLEQYAGFKNIQRYNWRHTEHAFVDDYSQAYLPHLDKCNGELFSLNVEATK